MDVGRELAFLNKDASDLPSDLMKDLLVDLNFQSGEQENRVYCCVQADLPAEMGGLLRHLEGDELLIVTLRGRERFDG